MATKKATKSGGAAKGGGSDKRTLTEPNGDKRYVRRRDDGTIKESDDQGRSLSKDVKQRAKKTVPSGQGDKGDQKKKAK